MAEQQSPIQLNPSQAKAGLNLDAAISDLKPGEITFSLNAVTSDVNGNSIKYQNEPGSHLCTGFPDGYQPNGRLAITEDDVIVFWLVNPVTEESEIGTVSECVYTTYINDVCLDLDVDHPIHKAFHRITPLGTEVYWTDAKNNRRYINLSKKPLLEIPDADGCGFTTNGSIDCNLMNVQPNFDIPSIDVEAVEIGGLSLAGTYQFAVQYASADGEPYTSFYSVTNPLPLSNNKLITPDFNYQVGKSIKLTISNIDTSGVYQFLNIAVVKTVNEISTPELLGTYKIEKSVRTLIYSGQSKTNVQLSIEDIFEKYPIYEKAGDIFVVDDVLGWADLTTNERLNYQSIWSQVHLQWQTSRVPLSEGYQNEITSTDEKGYFRDETYAMEGCFLLANGHQVDKCHIPCRKSTPDDLTLIDNGDVVHNTDVCQDNTGGNKQLAPKWSVYNTASLHGFEDEWTFGRQDDCYHGPYQYGEFAYSESSDSYPCDTVLWGDLAGLPIRHHRFPDSSITHIHDNAGNIYPLGIKVDVQELVTLINQSSLTDDQKKQIVGFKILRADRINNKTVIARGLIHNVLKYSASGNFTADGQVSIQDQTNHLIDQTIGLLQKAEGVLNIVLRQDDYNKLQAAITNLNIAKTLVIGSVGYKQALTDANTLIQIVVDKNESDTANSYLDGAQSIIQNLLEIDPIDTTLIEGSVSTDELYFPNYPYNDVSGTDPFLNNTLIDDSSKERYVFHSPDTHFYQPYLGNTLKLETIEYGDSEGHIVEVKNHSKYQFVSTIAYITAALSGLAVGFASGQYGVSTQPFDGTAAFTAYKTILDILYKVSPRRNFCYQHNSVGVYNKYLPVANTGNKQRRLDIATYLVPGMQSVGDDLNINNFQRESSVYLKTDTTLPFTHEANPSVTPDNSKFLVPDYGIIPRNISSYYATIKNNVADQYGEIYSYESIDTGFQRMINLSSSTNSPGYVFGGDCFINKFAYKSKIPLFIDNRVGFPDESDVFYNELNNVGQAKYWFSTDVTSHNTIFGSIFGVKPHKFFWERDGSFTDYGNIFLFVYGIPYFFCESEVNVDLRQAFNDKEGDFFPRVSSGIPDEWLQEIHTTIKQDNTYFYNKTFSKQNKENYFTSIPVDYDESDQRQFLTHSAMWSDQQKEITNYKHNNWLLYKPVSRFDFPKNYGPLLSVDGVADKQVLVRMQNNSFLYPAYITLQTSASTAYLGNPTLFNGGPPVDFAKTETGSAGGYNKMLIQTEAGPIMCDTKRGTVMLFQEASYMKRATMRDISGNLSSFFINELTFYLKKSFPNFPVDNHFKDVGLTGVYDSFHDRIIITKRDYQLIDPSVAYTNGVLMKGSTEVELTDTRYFIDKSFTFSFGFDINGYVSFHTYIPNYYVPDPITFFSGYNDDTPDLWSHRADNTLLNNFRGVIHPYIIEYPYSYKYQDEILQNIKDYSRVLKYETDGSSVQTNDVFFNKAILRNAQQCSGVLELVSKPRHSLQDYMKYPKYNSASKTIVYTKSDSFYNYNTFWSLIKDNTKPILIPSKTPSMFWDLNNVNMNYSKMSYGKAPIRSKDLTVRHILDNTSRYKIISEFIVAPTQISYK